MTTRGRKPIPTVLKLLVGMPGHSPINANEPHPEVPRGIDPPEYLGRDATKVWRAEAPKFHRLGLLTEADVHSFAAWCDSFVLWRVATAELDRLLEAKGAEGLLHRTKEGNIIQLPLVGIANKAAERMTRLGAEFGMTPSSRTRIDSSLRNGNDDW